MPLYSLKCPDCLEVEEYFMGMHDEKLVVDCYHCGHGLTRESHRHYMSDIPQIQGDTVAGGCNYHYYDQGMECQVNGKQHRRDEMKRRNLTEFSPDAGLQKHRKEALRIIKSAPKGDADAAKAAAVELDAARKKRTAQVVDRAWDKAGLSSGSQD